MHISRKQQSVSFMKHCIGLTLTSFFLICSCGHLLMCDFRSSHYVYYGSLYSFRGRLGVPFIHLFVYICWCYRVVAVMICYNSIASSTCKNDMSASAICHLQRFKNWCIGRTIQVSSCCFGGLSCNSSFYFAASWVQSMTRRQLNVRTSLLY